MENLTNIFLAERDNFSESFKTYIHSDVDTIFPLLNNTEKDLIKRMNMSLLILIYHRFHFESEQQFYQQISNKNNQDIRMILFLLFPYINDDDNFKIHKSIVNLKDLSINQKNTNIQYDRGFSENDNNYEYNILDVYNNYIASYDTIHKCAYRLYCNWSQVIPLTLTNYHESYIYKDTISYQENNEFNQDFPDNQSLTGLDIRDCYHVLINDMFMDILPYKWLLYEKYDTTLNKDVMYIEEILDYFKVIDGTLDNLNNFIQQWPSFYSTINSDILYNILLHFDVISHQYLSDSSIKKINNNEDEIYNKDESDTKNKFEELKEQYNKSDVVEPIYNFLYATLLKFSKTLYGKMMFPNNKNIFSTKELVQLKDVEFAKIKEFNEPIYANSYVSYKNIYNYSKSLLFNQETNSVFMCREWDGLNFNQKRILKFRINGNINNWFNISRNLQIKYGSYVNTYGITQRIYESINSMLIKLTFHSLISRGILNEFKVKHSKDKIEESFDGYYFITQDKYVNLMKYIPDKNVDPTSLILDVLGNKSNVQKLFAMDWLQQIHFYKHFFNQRVTFVTGGTGTGKSTQVPKLLWYGLFLLGNYSGKVVNTQPRINATTGNSSQISKELGVPIKVYSYTNKKSEETQNYYIQYSTSNEKHMDQDNSVPSYLKIVTDATLLETVKKSPFLKTTYLENKQIKETDVNAYDVISIDEAHEHNTNMDLLLTFLRDTIQLNNTLRLVIITATIDADEHIYRRFYKYINDNLLSPLNNTLFNNDYQTRYINGEDNPNKIIMDIAEYLNINIGIIGGYNKLNFDRISLDRRVHIAPPQGLTNYKIEDIYYPRPVETYEDAERLGIEKAVEISKFATGEILFFSVTQPKIDAIVTELNKRIPNRWIALPYYSKISSEWKKIIENIDTNINFITLDKKDILKAVNGEDYNNKNNSKYDHAIIVSTNIAEASITIPSLKFVIETGYVNVVSFDPVLEVDVIGSQKITESARIQRRGRVGRKQSGTVYYMYEKDSRKNIANRYNITQQINTLVYNLIDYINEGNEELLRANLDYLNPDNQNFYPNNYLGNYNQNYPYIKSQSGYSYETILDPLGTFYMVHPLEILLGSTRDPYTGRFSNPNIKQLKPFQKYFNHLFTLRLITYSNENNEFIKSKIYSIYNELKDDINEIMPAEKMNYNKLLTMILGARYGKLEECLFIYNIVNKENSISLSSLSRKMTSRSGAIYVDSSLMMEKFGNTHSDIQVYLNIYNKLKLILPSLVDMDSNELISEYNKINHNLTSTLSPDDIESLKNYEKRNRDKIRKVSIFKNSSKIDNKRVELWCDQNGLDYTTIDKLIQLYISDHRAVKFIYEWVQKYKNYIPYFPEMNNLEFIFISSYVNYSIANLDDREDYLKELKDPISLVNGNKILGLLKEVKNKERYSIKHLIRFDQVYVPAVIPALLYYVENNLFTWATKNYYYRTVTPYMIEKYLIPESNVKEENRKIKIYNNKLLSLLRLLR